jgi:hypothetical protein
MDLTEQESLKDFSISKENLDAESLKVINILKKKGITVDYY